MIGCIWEPPIFFLPFNPLVFRVPSIPRRGLNPFGTALSFSPMNQWITEYITAQKAVIDSIPVEAVAKLVRLFKQALRKDRQIFVFGNGGSAANASHFVTDLGKGASDKVGKRFRCLALNDNISWMTAIGNDYAFEDVFARQLENHGHKGDVALAISVSGSSPNVVKAVEWANKHGLESIALVGGKKGALAQIAGHVIVIDSTHYGRVEDAQMAICHMICYAFMENPHWGTQILAGTNR